MYEIQNYLGVKLCEVTREELDTLLINAETDRLNYFQYDAIEENDLVKRWESEEDVTDKTVYRIYKYIGIKE